MADTPKTPAELAEQLLQAMKIVSDSSLNQISFDKTEICTILGKENESANNNCYFVTNGSMRFKAYVPQSTDGKQVKYKKDDSVRVSIPNGDYTKKKIIEGLSVDEDNDNPTIFVSPLETMLEITDSIVPETEASQTYGLTANGSVDEICLWSADFDGDKKYRDIQNSDICDSIALKADFKTVFANSNVIKGHYGLRLDLYFHTADNEDDGFYNVNQHSVYLDSANMFGNPYSFLIYSTQAIKFSIKDFGILKCANLYFYQKKDFEKLNDKGIKEIIPSKKFNNKSDKYYEARTALKLLVEEKDSEEYKSILTEANAIAEELIELCSLKQENGDYEIKDGEIIIPYKSLELDNNLLVKNLYLSFGSDIVDIDDNVFKIFCNDDLSYNEDAIATTESIDDYKELGLLWYNKDENGKYVGFSDGIYDEDYDEIEYIKSSSADARLLAQKGRDCPYDFAGLTLAANLQDEKQLYSEIYNLINKDLYNELRAFESRFKSVIDVEPTIKNAFDNILINNETDGHDSLSEFLAYFEEQQKYFIEQYEKVLLFAKAWQNAKLLGESKPVLPEGITSKSINTYANGIQMTTIIYNWVKRISPDESNLDYKYNLFKPLSNIINSKYQSFQSIYDSFTYRINSVYKKITEKADKISEMVKQIEGKKEADVSYLSWYLFEKDKNDDNEYYIERKDYDFKEYASVTEQEENKLKNDNRYCVYWFRYQPNAATPDEEPRILDKKWKRITVNEKVNGRNITNLGVPLLSLKGEDGENYNEKRDTDEILGINLDTTIKTEKIKAVLYYNHTKYESNEIEFTNLNPYTEQDAADQNGALYIEHGENSKDSYQSYGVNNCLNNAADSYTTRYLKIRFDGKQGKDEYLNDAQVFWYMPRNSTMLTYDLDDYGTDFTNDTIDTTERLIVKITKNLSSAEKTLITNSKWVEGTQEVEWKDQNGVTWRFEGISSDNKILYFNRGSNNLGKYTSVSLPSSLKWDYIENKVNKTLELSCDSSWEMIQKSDVSIDRYYCFYRTINENADSRLFPYHISDYYSASFSQNEIICKVIPKGSTTTLEASIIFTFSSYGTSGTDYTLVIAPTGTRAAVDPNYKDDLNNNLVLQAKLYDYKNEEIVFKDDEKIDLTCSWVGDDKLSPYNCLVADNKIAITIAQVSDGEGGLENDTADMQYYGVLKSEIDVTVAPEKVPTEEDTDEDGNPIFPPTENKNSRKVTLTTFTVIPYMNGNYFVEGPSIVVYDGQGANPTYYKNPFRIFNSITKKELTEVSWSIGYYKETGWFLNSITDGKIPDKINNNGTLVDNPETKYRLSYNFMPTLGKNNELIPCNMFIGNTDLYPVVMCKDGAGTVIWAQPIYLMQNRYPSAMVNSWDGSFQIDEENGTVMSTMLGAGRKNTNNKFEGILMGNVYQATGDNATDIGLYGFHDGAQSFNFNIDGTAFLGKAGHGRIVFNGNEGTIKSAGYDTGEGMLIDLDDNFINAKGNFILTAGDSLKKSDGYLALSSGGKYAITDTINGHFSEDWRIIAGDKFAVDGSGFFTASNANITGTITTNNITATYGTIGDFYLENGALYTNSRKTVDEKRYHGVHLSSDGISVVAKGGTSYFMANTNSNLLEFTGKIVAGSGEIAGWEIESDYLGFFTTSGDGTNEFFLSRKGKKLWVPVAGKEMTCLCDFGGMFAIDTTGSLYADNANISGIINATEGGHIGKWYIDSSGNLKSDSGLVTLNGTTGEIKGSSISGSSISGSSITSTGSNKAFTLDNEGKCIIKNGEIEDYLHINGKIYIGDKASSSYLISGQEEQIRVEGDAVFNGEIVLNGEERNIYLSSKKKKGARLNAIGQDQAVLIGMTGVFLKGYGYYQNTETIKQTSNGINLRSQTNVYIAAGSDLDGSGDKNGDIVLEANEIYVKINGANKISLSDYIKNIE